ncbi:MAG: RNA 2',3'-cyclic phosphodiesterase [Coriobacteriaceae bacterium]|nr:RNA 2',3'-cyclic phosphodiesterase [Coriobacteriaceae bacterium]
MRAFIALELPEAFWRDTAALARELGTQVTGRFLKAQTYHLTLAFLGDIDDAGKQRAVDAIDAACAGLAAIPLACDGLGKFGRAQDATLWLGIQRSGNLEQLARRMREELDVRGIGYDSKPFKPHITLARRARIPRSPLPALAFPRDDIATDVTLFKSELSHEGASYKPLYTVRLHGMGDGDGDPS